MLWQQKTPHHCLDPSKTVPTEDELDESHTSKDLTTPRQPRRRRRRLLCILVGALVGITVLAIALGVGLGVGLAHRDSSSSSSPPSTPTPTAVNATTTNTTGTNKTNHTTIWQPSAGIRWQIELESALSNTSLAVPVYDIDLFTNTAATISALHAQGRRVICYFSAGSYEPDRPDTAAFPAAALGHALAGWPDERWIDVSDARIRALMAARLDRAAAIGCDGVDPDNVDGYAAAENDDDDSDSGSSSGSGIPALTVDAAAAYVRWLAGEARARGLAIGLKNAAALIPRVMDLMAWSVNEQCVRYAECDAYAPFVRAGKPVFHIEYPAGAPRRVGDVQAACGGAGTDGGAEGFSSVLKNMDLDDWVVECPP